MFLNKNTFGRKALSVMLAAAMLSSIGVTTAVTTTAAETTEVKSEATTATVTSNANQYGLKDDIQDGVILHAWQWSLDNIKSKLPQIAEAGYTAVQTTVLQKAKESTAGKTNEVWWLFYQPAAFELVTDSSYTAIGTKTDLEELCAEADKYGIKIIVDVVANHLGNASGYDLSSAIPDDIRNDTSCWHSEGFTEINYGDRYSITHGSMSGLPDLNTESTKIQGYVTNYLKSCIDAGVDGFRFDAAKHISVPAEGSEYTFWPNVLNSTTTYAQSKGVTPYYYGEILGDTGGPAISAYTTYMSITDSSTGNNIRGSVAGGNATGAANSYYNSGAAANKVVLWAESHDTYSNESKESTYVSDSNINKTWALVASRNNATALYFARTDGYRGGSIGSICSTQCFNKEVAEVNKFHNYFAGQSEYLSSSGSIAYNERGTSGVVLVNCGGTSTSVSVKANKMADGTYTDQVSGSTFTVSGGTISGQIGSTGIAVVYNAVPQAGMSATPGTSGGTYKYKSDTLTVTLNATNVTDAKYSLDGGTATSFTDGTKITLGSGKAYETSQTLTLTGTNTTTNASINQTYTYYKTNQGTTIYFDNSSYNWSKVYAYIYTEDTTANEVAAWPGVQLTNKSATSGYYYYDLPDGFDSASVIFSDGVDGTSNRYPADMEPGLAIGGSSKLFTSGNTWKDYSETITPTDPTTPSVPTGSYVKGDATGDKKVGMKDCAVMQKSIIGSMNLSELGKLAADVDGDGEIGTTDVVIIMKYLVGFADTFGVGTVVTGPVGPTDPPTDPPVSDNVVYYYNSNGWSTVTAYYWSDSNKTMTTWPGKAMTSIGNNEYSIEVPADATYIIFSNNGGSKTADLTLEKGKIYKNGSWQNYSPVGPIDPTDPPTPGSNTVYLNDSAIHVGDERYAIYVWKSDSDNKWIDMTSAGTNLYQATVPDGYTNIIFCRMNGGTSENNWNNKWNQSNDLTFNSSQNLYTVTGWGSNGIFNGNWSAK